MLVTLLIAIAVQGSVPAPPPTHDPWLIFFQKGETGIIGDGRSVLANVPTAFGAPVARCIELVGHADFDEGSDKQRVQLSEARAAATKRILVDSGMPTAAFRVRGVGDRHPITAKPNPSNRFVSIDFCPVDR